MDWITNLLVALWRLYIEHSAKRYPVPMPTLLNPSIGFAGFVRTKRSIRGICCPAGFVRGLNIRMCGFNI